MRSIRRAAKTVPVLVEPASPAHRRREQHCDPLSSMHAALRAGRIAACDRRRIVALGFVALGARSAPRARREAQNVRHASAARSPSPNPSRHRSIGSPRCAMRRCSSRARERVPMPRRCAPRSLRSPAHGARKRSQRCSHRNPGRKARSACGASSRRARDVRRRVAFAGGDRRVVGCGSRSGFRVSARPGALRARRRANDRRSTHRRRRRCSLP